MFSKILIANRGEIACRIMRTCQRLGIRTVAVYSEADARALHVDMADEAYFVGPSPALHSYLNRQALIDIAKTSGAQAIHPGYGFLSENGDFAEQVTAAGLTFIGPSATVIRMMGDKLQAKAIAAQAKVPLIPGTQDPVVSVDQVKKFAMQIGYPLLLKAAGGGGGKGMRIVYQEEDIADFLDQVRHEAMSSFADERIFVEKYLSAPHHIEIQILADTYGTVVHLGERDCSLQRRHQKVIEESPSLFITPELRQAMTEQAIALARHVGYASAGTVEFMVTPDRQFYFLEMNTRLQVEHPVTEMVTGLDLVEQMIRIAAGERLPFTQNQISFTGHAMEARLYAEDAEQGFLPCSGRLTRFEPPVGEGVRLDTGVDAGTEVSIYYDPMMAKLIAWGSNRAQVLQNLQHSLAHFIIKGPLHNLGFLERLLHHPQVNQGNVSTRFIEQEALFELSAQQQEIMQIIAAFLYHQAQREKDSAEWVIAQEKQGVLVKVKGDRVEVECGNVFEIRLDAQVTKNRFIAYTQGQAYYGQAWLDPAGLGITIKLFGYEQTFRVMRPPIWDLFAHLDIPTIPIDDMTLKAQMPGMVLSVPIQELDEVKVGQPLLVIEAMKMENTLKSPYDAMVRNILVHAGDKVSRGQILIRLEKI